MKPRYCETCDCPIYPGEYLALTHLPGLGTLEECEECANERLELPAACALETA